MPPPLGFGNDAEASQQPCGEDAEKAQSSVPAQSLKRTGPRLFVGRHVMPDAQTVCNKLHF